MLDKSTRQDYLDAIGIQSWQLRSNDSQDIPLDTEYYESAQHETELSVTEQYNHMPHEPDIKSALAPETQTPEVTAPETMVPEIIASEMEPSKIQVQNTGQTDLNHLDGKTKTKSDEVVSSEKSFDKSIHIVSKPVTLVSELEQSIHDCKLCSNRQTRLNAIAGQGNESASVFVISEAPTAEEDRYGHYLNDQTTLLFTSMLKTINANTDYFYTGIIKCYSFSEYLVNEQEVLQCQKYLHTQINQVQPAVLFALGATQAQSLLQTKVSFNDLRGKIHHITINDIEYPLIVSYHPSYLLRNSLYKRNAMKDLLLIKSLKNG